MTMKTPKIINNEKQLLFLATSRLKELNDGTQKVWVATIILLGKLCYN